jgi:hypothetical protein
MRFGPPNYENVSFGMLSVCTYVCICITYTFTSVLNATLFTITPLLKIKT